MTTAGTGQTVLFVFRVTVKSGTNADAYIESSNIFLKFLSERTETGGRYYKTRHRPGKETEEIMRKSMAVFIALAVLAAGGAAWALDTNTLTVTANVVGTCKFSNTTSTLAFGPLDPSVGGTVNGSNTTQFWCTRGVPAATLVALNGLNWSGTSRRMVGPAPTDLIPYSLTLLPDALPNAGPGSPRTLTISGSIVGTDYTGATAGNYSDTVSVTINP
jgi:spore coat protein U-like protein